MSGISKKHWIAFLILFLYNVHHFTTYTNESIVAESIVSMLS